MSPAQVLLEQARMEKSKQRLLSQEVATTSNSLAHPNIVYDLQVLSTSTSDTQPSLLLTFGDQKYLFNSPSSTARLCTSNQIRIKKISHIFLGELDESDGLPGIILSSFEAGNRHLGIIGPIGTGHLIASYRSYCRRDSLSCVIVESPIDSVSRSHSPSSPPCLPLPIHKDSNIAVYALPLSPRYDEYSVRMINQTATSRGVKRSRSSRSPSPSSDQFEASRFNLHQPFTNAFSSGRSEHDFARSMDLTDTDSDHWRDAVIRDMFLGQETMFIDGYRHYACEPSGSVQALKNNFMLTTPAYIPKRLPAFSYWKAKYEDGKTQKQVLSYLVVGPRTRGRFSLSKAKERCVQPGPLYSKLVRGERVWIRKDMFQYNLPAINKSKRERAALLKAAKEAQKNENPAEKEDGVGEGHWVDPSECMEESRDGISFLILNIPSPEYLHNLSSVSVSAVKSAPNCSLGSIYYLLGPGVLLDPLFTGYMATFDGEDVIHRISSPDMPNNDTISFTGAALMQLKLSYFSPEIFRLPQYSFLPSPPPPSPPPEKQISAPLLKTEPESTTPSQNATTPTFSDDHALFPVVVPPTTFLLRPLDKFDRGITLTESAKSFQKFNFVVPSLEADRAVRGTTLGGGKQNSRDTFLAYKLLADKIRKEIKDQEKVMADSNRIPSIGDDLKVTPLGTGSAVPSKYRNVSATLLHLPGSEGYILLDAGEGTWGQIARRFGNGDSDGISKDDILRNLKIIFVSHMHADHNDGVATLLRQRAKLNPPPVTPLFLIGKINLHDYLLERQDLFDLNLLNTWLPKTFLSSCKLKSPRSNAVHFISSDYFEGIRHEASDEVMTCIQSVVKLESIRTVQVKHRCRCWGIVLQHRSGWKVVFSGDTVPCLNLAILGEGATLLIHEATMDDNLLAMAELKGHSTVGGAIEIGRKMKAKYLLLTHFSARYPTAGSLRSNSISKSNGASPLLQPLIEGQGNQTAHAEGANSGQTLSQTTQSSQHKPIVAIAFDLATMRLDEFWKMEKFREAQEILFNGPEEEGESSPSNE